MLAPVFNCGRSAGVQNLLRFLFLLFVVMHATFDSALAQDVPPSDILRAIAEKLPHQPQTRGTIFEASSPAALNPVCKMRHFTMTLATGSTSARSLAVLLNQEPANDDAQVTLLAVLHHLTVDADGSPRSYHPDDPHGTGACMAYTGPDGKEAYRGVCALEDFASAHLLIFKGAQQLREGKFEAPWREIWPLIRDEKLPVLDLQQYEPSAPDGYYFFYWKERELSAFFKREIIPQASDGFPCRRDSGYFVAATTLKQDGEVLPNGCAPSHYMDAEHIPFVVWPDDAFGNARTGDIVVARLAGAPSDQVVYGVVGDTGPVAQLGEASIAFNRGLLGKSKPIMNGRDTWGLEIRGENIIFLVLGGTKSQLKGDYSPRNIEEVGQREFARWNSDPLHPTKRLDACARQLGFK
jgi:hypothetical protein